MQAQVPSSSSHADAAAVAGPGSRCLTCKLRKVKCSGPPQPCHNCSRLNLECTFSATGPTGARLVSPSESLTEAGTVRRRAATACDGCRAQKAKCSGRLPRCARCELHGLQCTYTERSRRYARGSRSRKPASTGSPRLAHPPSTPLGRRESPAYSNGPSTDDSFRLHPAPLPPPSVNAAADRAFLRRDVGMRHIEAYFDHVYPLQGYDFFHRPSLLESFYNDRLPPILCTAICATAATFISPSKASRATSIEWSKEVDRYLFSNMNRLNLLNLQLIILSMFQHYAYRQFGRVWVMHGAAARLALAFQLNEDRPPGPGQSPVSVTERECLRRLMWSVFVRDRLLSGGVDEFIALPDQWMRLPLPCNEHCFQNELPQETGTLCDSANSPSRRELGSRGFLLILQSIHHRILRTTKSFLMRKDVLKSPSEMQKAVTSLVGLKGELCAFYESIPPHLKLSDRNIFSHCNTSEFSGFIVLHTWFFLCSSDLFRICLPGPLRESAPSSLLAAVPSDLVQEWRSLAISFALRLARTWQYLQDLKRSGKLQVKQPYLPINPASSISIHQCTKVLLLARRANLYSGLIDPLTGAPTTLDDSTVEELCWSNVSYLGGMAAIAPVSAVVHHDVRDMLERELRRSRPSSAEPREYHSPITSEVQRQNILSRYHPLSMGLVASNNPDDSDDPYNSRPADASSSAVQTVSFKEPPPIPKAGQNYDAPVASSQRQDVSQGSQPALASQVPPTEQQQLPVLTSDLATQFQPDICQLGGAPLIFGVDADNYPPEYSVAPSQYDMGGELDWFMMSPFWANQSGGPAAQQQVNGDPLATGLENNDAVVDSIVRLP